MPKQVRLPKTVLVDSGPLIALFDRSDAYHEKILAFIRDTPYRFVTSLAVLTEVSHMLDFNVNTQIDFFEWVMSRGLDLEEITQDDIPRIINLTKKYADLPMDFADATLVVAAEKTGIREIVSIDAQAARGGAVQSTSLSSRPEGTHSDFNVYRLPGKLLIRNIFPL
ncbi:MAG: PIN domain-containing protein [Treponema sp.]|nr:PIN domain-containing protein [Treponema sp.]